MTGVNVNEGSETFTRLIGRLSMEINQLTRETPLLEGRLLELEAQSHPTVAQFYESRRRSARRVIVRRKRKSILCNSNVWLLNTIGRGKLINYGSDDLSVIRYANLRASISGGVPPTQIGLRPRLR